VVDTESRKICSNPDCSHIVWENPVPVAAGLVEYDGQYVLARNVKWPKGIYSMITGYVEKAELPETTIRRETQEELGLSTVSTSFIGHYMYKEKNQLIIAYFVKADGNLTLGNELAEFISVPQEKMLKYVNKNLYITRKVIEDFLNSFSSI